MRIAFLVLAACATGACHGNSSPAAATDAGHPSGEDSGAPIANDAGPGDASPFDASIEASPPGDDAGDDSDDDAGDDAAPPEDASDATVVDAGIDAPTTGPALPSVLDPSAVGATGIALDDTNVYYATGGGVSGVPRAGGTVFTVASLAPGNQGGTLTQQDGVLYWDPLNFGTTQLRSIPTTSRNAPAGIVGAFGLSAFGFVVANGVAYGANSCNWIAEIPINSGTTDTFVSLGCNARPQWIGLVSDPTSGTVDVLDRYELVVDRISVATRAVTSFAVPANTGTLLLQGGKLYWITYDSCTADGGCTPSTLYGAALDGSNAAVVATANWSATASAYAGIPAISTDTYVYVILGTQVARITLATGENHVVYTAVGNVAGVAADADAFFVIDSGAGLLRIPN